MKDKMAQRIGNAIQASAQAVAKPRGDVTGVNAGGMDRMMGMRQMPMSSGGMRPQGMAVQRGMPRKGRV